MAKVKLTKGKSSPTKRNVARSVMTWCVYLNLAATVFILLKLYGIDLIEITQRLIQG